MRRRSLEIVPALAEGSLPEHQCLSDVYVWKCPIWVPLQEFPEEIVMQMELAKELLDLETQFWNSMKNKDIDAALRLTYEPCIVAGAQGVSSIDKQTFAKLMATGAWTLHDFDIHDVQVQQLNEEVAVIGYKVHEELTVDGKPITLDAADASTWVKKNGRWLCALHTESLAGDPYGRDRKRSH